MTIRPVTITSAEQLFTLPTDRTTWSYDEATGLLTNKLYADDENGIRNGTSYTYTPEGQLETRTWARGVVTTYSYDPIGQLTTISYGQDESCPPTPDIAFTHDRIGRQATVTDSQGTHIFAYDPATLALTNEMVVADGVTNIIARTQDSLGRNSGFTLAVAGVADPGYSVAYGYSEVGRFESVDSVVLGVTNNWQYSYLQDSDMIAQLTESNAGITATRTYEPNRNLLADINNQWGSTPVSTFAYQNDAVGRRTKRIDNASITNDFGYNIRSEVIEALMGTNTYGYAYDPIGNRLSASKNTESLTYLANALNQYTNITDGATVEPQYDADGNMVSNGAWTFTWNGENRLVAASNATTVIENAYDYMGRRFQKTVNGVKNTFVYDGWAMIREASPTVTNSYVYGVDLSGSMQGAGTIGGILTANLNGTTAYYFYDANGNVTDLVGTNGSSVAHYEYGPFGQTVAKSGTLADANPFRFSTKYLDDSVDLYYYGLRYNSPELGRWINRDPLSDEFMFARREVVLPPPVSDDFDIDGISRAELERWLYSFVRNSPISVYDILGLKNYCCKGKKDSCEKGETASADAYCCVKSKCTSPKDKLCTVVDETKYDGNMAKISCKYKCVKPWGSNGPWNWKLTHGDIVTPPAVGTCGCKE